MSDASKELIDALFEWLHFEEPGDIIAYRLARKASSKAA